MIKIPLKLLLPFLNHLVEPNSRVLVYQSRTCANHLCITEGLNSLCCEHLTYNCRTGEIVSGTASWYKYTEEFIKEPKVFGNFCSKYHFLIK